MDNAENKRSAYWDNIKGFLILLVVFAHILFQFQDISFTINGIVDYIYMFHMPVFVFVSGFFGKSEHSHSFESIIKLIFLYFIFNSIIGFIYGFTSVIQPMYSYWYLAALIVWRLTAHHIAKFKEINLILLIIAVFVGFYPAVDNTFALARIIGFYPYYMSGYQLSAEKDSELQNKKYTERAAVGLLVLSGTALLAWGAYSFFNYSDSALQMASYNTPNDAFGRIILFIIAFLAVYIIRCISPNSNIPLITSFGKNSLWIFILHRPFTIMLSSLIEDFPIPVIIILSVIASFAMCILFGNKFVVKYMNKFLSGGADIFISDSKKFTAAKFATLAVSLWFVISVVINSYSGLAIGSLKNLFGSNTPQEEITETESSEIPEETDVIYPIMTDEQKNAFDNAFRITFAGDLILLEDQVKRAYNGKEFDFTDVFEYAEPYISSADFAIGVFEGPMAGSEAGYTSGNYDDGKALYLNFPDEFASAVKNAGFDLVTNANNHLLDKGESGALRTIDVLDKIGLDHTGAYKNMESKRNEHIKYIECRGIKMAVLSYTFGSNYIDNSELIDGSLSYITSVICGTEGEQFEALKKSVEEDFKSAKEMSPDLMIVLPHIGTQFLNEPDSEQKVWFDIFKENGADIILGDHPHVVEPALIENYNGKNVFIAYCPGNFANIYRENQGDTSMLTDVYIDRHTKKIIGGSVVPLYTYAPADKNFRAVPVYDMVTNAELRKQLTTDDMQSAANANRIVTSVVFGHEMDISAVSERYYFNKDGFIRQKTTGLELTDHMKENTLYKAMRKAKSICFVGDSVTEGTKNGGCPWYEPIEEYFPDKSIYNYSKGGCTVSYMTEHKDDIPEAELYVIALGTNDVRYRDESICAMTKEDYVSALDELKKSIEKNNKNAEYIFIAPWYSTDGDLYCYMSFEEKTALNEEYCDELQKYCSANSLGYINPNGFIRNQLVFAPDREYLLDHIHPNSSKGVVMYSEAVLNG